MIIRVIAVLSAFRTAYNPMLNSDLSSLEVNIVDRQRTEVGCTQSGVQQGQDNRLIAVGARPAHDKLFSLFSLRFPRIDTGFIIISTSSLVKVSTVFF
jgi:hypothetical protein